MGWVYTVELSRPELDRDPVEVASVEGANT